MSAVREKAYHWLQKEVLASQRACWRSCWRITGWGWGEHGNVIKKERFGLRDAAWQKDKSWRSYFFTFVLCLYWCLSPLHSFPCLHLYPKVKTPKSWRVFQVSITKGQFSEGKHWFNVQAKADCSQSFLRLAQAQVQPVHSHPTPTVHPEKLTNKNDGAGNGFCFRFS